jgi:endonuclease III
MPSGSSGIALNTHVLHLSQRLGLTQAKESPYKIEADLLLLGAETELVYFFPLGLI